MDNRPHREAEFHDRKYSSGQSPTAGFYGALRPLQAAFLTEIEQRAPGAKVLEYGCGKGGRALRLAELGASVTGIDISRTGVAQAKREADRRNLGAQFEVMDAEELQFEDSRFDLICGSAILHHLNLAAAMSQITRVLKPDGTAIFLEPLGHNPIINLVRRATPQLRTVDEHPLLVSDIRMLGNYFRDVTVAYGGLLTLLALPVRKFFFFDRVVGVLSQLEARLFQSIPLSKRLAWATVVTCRRPYKL